MNVHLTRDSVAAGDDADAPHQKTLMISNTSNVEEIIMAVVNARYLASISGGHATWSAISNIPVAVVAQEWDKPKMLSAIPIPLKSLDVIDNAIRLHFCYHAQRNPDDVFEVLRPLASMR
jgi:hypothetical protein